jgi:Flp pilus assembly protein TadB
MTFNENQPFPGESKFDTSVSDNASGKTVRTVAWVAFGIAALSLLLILFGVGLYPLLVAIAALVVAAVALVLQNRVESKEKVVRWALMLAAAAAVINAGLFLIAWSM